MTNAQTITQFAVRMDYVVGAWYTLGRCEDEFGTPSAECAEYADHLDDTIIGLQSALRDVYTCPRCEGQKHDQGTCDVCANRGYVFPSELERQAKEQVRQSIQRRGI